MDKKERVIKIIEIFDRLYSDAECSLMYENELQLLIATQLSAQCTDARVNIVSKELFKKYKNVYAFANADLKSLEKEIKSTGFYHNKAKNIINCCKKIIRDFDGKVPDNQEDMLKLDGVGRKTANLVLGDIYGIPGIVVDTHAKRISQRIGLTKSDDPKKVEFDLMNIVPKKNWNKFCHQMVYHGRQICKARKPDCANCEIINYCNYKQKTI